MDGWMDGWRWAPSSTSPLPLWRCASIVTQRRCKELIGFNSLPLQCQVWLFIAPLKQAALPRLPSALAARCLSKSPFSTLWDCWYDSLRHAADFWSALLCCLRTWAWCVWVPPIPLKAPTEAWFMVAQWRQQRRCSRPHQKQNRTVTTHVLVHSGKGQTGKTLEELEKEPMKKGKDPVKDVYL